MTNKTLFWAKLIILSFFSLTSNVHKLVSQSLDEGPCNLAPPSNFRLEAIGSNFISLAWEPLDIGATHTISLYAKNNLGNWDLVNSFESINGKEYTINGISFNTELKATIATNCDNDGGPSSLTAEIDHINLIIELTVAGRAPINPTVVDCQKISYLNNWIGFKIDYESEGITISNTFEVVLKDIVGDVAHTYIKRVGESPIYAVDWMGNWPVFKEKNIISDNPFIVSRLFSNQGQNILDEIGDIEVSINFFPKQTVNICPTSSWDNSYSFHTLIANEATERSQVDESSFSVQSLFNSQLRITNAIIPNCSEGKAKIRLTNMNGQIFYDQIHSASGDILIQTSLIPNGLYFIQIECNGQLYCYKAIKEG